MRMFHLAAAAGLVVAALGVGSSADARDHRDYRGNGAWHDQGRHDGYGHRRYDDRRWNGHGRRWHQRCWTEWRHHHRVRVCR